MTKREDREARKELLKEDEFLSTMERWARYAQENPGRVFGAALLVVAAVFGFTKFKSYRQNVVDEQAATVYQSEKILEANLQDEKADLKFSSEQERYSKALETLNANMGELSGPALQQARLQKITCLINLNRRDEIESIYKDVIADDYGFKFFAIASLGDFYLENGDYDQAVSQYNALASSQSAVDFKDLVDYKLGVAYKEKGDLDEARRSLSSLVDRYQDLTDPTGKPPVVAKAQALLDEISPSDGDASGENS